MPFGAAPRSTNEPVQDTTPPQSAFSLVPTPTPATNASSVPNFFANSQVLKEPTIPTPPPVLNFSATTRTTSTPNLTGSTSTGTGLFGIPPVSTKAANDSETNPFWDGGKDKAKEVVKLPHGVAGPGSSVFPPTPKADTAAEPASAPATAPEPPFSFGKPVEVKTPAASSTSAGPISLGQAAEDKPASLAPFPLGKLQEKTTAATRTTTATRSVPSLPFAFGQPDKPAASAVSFGTPAGAVKKEETAPAAPKPPFGAPSGSSNLFGEVPKLATTGLFGEKGASQFTAIPPPQSTPSPLSFAFGPPATSGATPSAGPAADEVPKPAFAFGSTATVAAPAVEVSAPNPLFGDNTFAFGKEKKEEDVKPSLFPFGATPSTTPTVSEAKPVSTPVFTFGQSATTTPTPISTTPAGVPPLSFSFSGGGSAGTDVTNKPPFIFGVPSSTATLLERPVTPPKGHDLDLRMEESPVRDMQVNGNGKAPEARPAIGSTAPFSFGSAGSSGVNGSSLFGAQGGTSSSTSPFAFGASSTSSNPFAPKKPEEAKHFGGFGAPQAPPINTSFSFGQQQPEENRPSSAGGLFAFGQTPTSATNPTPPFAFGGANASSNPFGAGTGSAPASPSTFAQPSSFNFGATSATNSSAFAFGSQPSSPAAAANATLPPPGGNAGFGQTPSPSSPFTAPLPLATSTSGGALFTIGAAPPAPPTGQRQIKKLPRRVPVKR